MRDRRRASHHRQRSGLHRRRFRAAAASRARGCRAGCRIDAALETVDRIGRQLVASASTGDRIRREAGALEEYARHVARDFRRHAAHHAGKRQRTRIVGDQQVGGSSSTSWPLSSVSVSPACARRTRMPPASFDSVERVHRLAQFQHHVVRDVDDRVDAANAGAAQPLAHPVRCARMQVDALARRGRRSSGSPRPSRSTDARRCPEPPRLAIDGFGALRARRRARATSRARPTHRQAVTAIGRDLEVEDVVVETQVLLDRRAEPRVGDRAPAGPSDFSASASSFAEHSMPRESTPRSLACLISTSARQARADAARPAPACRRARWPRRRRSAGVARRRRLRRPAGGRLADAARA